MTTRVKATLLVACVPLALVLLLAASSVLAGPEPSTPAAAPHGIVAASAPDTVAEMDGAAEASLLSPPVAPAANGDPPAPSTQVHLPVLTFLGDDEYCDVNLEVQNVGDDYTKAMVIYWDEPGFCPPDCSGPIIVETSGLLPPGSSWVFRGPGGPGQVPHGSLSAIVFSLSTEPVPENGDIIADWVSEWAYYNLIGDCAEYRQFKQSFDADGGASLFGFPVSGESLAVEVERSCPDPITPATDDTSAYSGIPAELTGEYGPVFGAYTCYTPILYAEQEGQNSYLYIQNAGTECTSVELWFKEEEDCLSSNICQIGALAPGETMVYDATDCVGPGWQGSAWIRSSQPLAIVVDNWEASFLASYSAVPEAGPSPGGTGGDTLLYAPLTYPSDDGWETEVTVQNLNSTVAASVTLDYLDASGTVYTQTLEWVCHRGSFTFTPTNTVTGWLQISSNNTDIAAKVTLHQWSDPAHIDSGKGLSYEALPAWRVNDMWHTFLPSLYKDLDGAGLTSDIVLVNFNPSPGLTEFRLYLYDQNGLLDFQDFTLSGGQMMYLSLEEWDAINPGFKGSAVIEAIRTTQAGSVSFGALSVFYRGTIAEFEIPGDEISAAVAAPPLIFDSWTPEPPLPYEYPDLPTGGTQQHLPALQGLGGIEVCEPVIEVQNAGDDYTKAMVIYWAEPGFCPPDATGPLFIECSGLLAPGSTWAFRGSQRPWGARSATVFSLSAGPTPDGGEVIADAACERSYYDLIGDHDDYRRFKRSFDEDGGAGFFGYPVVGEPLAVEVERKCTVMEQVAFAAYSGLGAETASAYDPDIGAFVYRAPLLYADQEDRNSSLHIQNVGLECTSVELWLRDEGACEEWVISEIPVLAPGEAVEWDPRWSVGPSWTGSAHIRASQPLAIVVDTWAENLLTTHSATAGHGASPGATGGDRLLYAPLTYPPDESSETTVAIRNLSPHDWTTVNVDFFDAWGSIVESHTVELCPDGSNTVVRPVSARNPSENTEWIRITSTDADVSAVVTLRHVWDPTGSPQTLEGVSYQALPAWRIAGMPLAFVPSVYKDPDGTGLTSVVALTNFNGDPGQTIFHFYLYDQNGLVDILEYTLAGEQMVYIDLLQLDGLNTGFKGSAVIEAEATTQAGLPAFGVVAVQRSDYPDAPRDEVAAVTGQPFPAAVTGELAISKSGTPDPVLAGEELWYDIAVTNNYTETATGVQVFDTLPGQVIYLADSGACIGPDESRRLICPIGGLVPGESRAFRIKTRIDPTAVAREADGAIVVTNTAQVRGIGIDANPADNTVVEPTFVQDRADLVVSKMSKPDEYVRAGDTFTYTIFVENHGPSAARNVVVSDTILSAELVTARVISSTEYTCDPSSETSGNNLKWTCTRNTYLDPGVLDEITIVATADETGDVNNLVRVTSDTPDPDLDNNQDEDYIYVGDVADLALTKSVEPGPHVAGTTVVYTLTVSNAGPSTAENVVVEDFLPEGATPVSVSNPHGSCTLGTPGDLTDPLTCSVGNLAPGDAPAVIEVMVAIDADYLGLLRNDAVVYGDILDPDTGNNLAWVSFEVTTACDLFVTKTDSPDPVRAGEVLYYDVLIGNQGPSTARDVVLTETLPPEVTFMGYQVVNGPGSCALSDRTLTCYLGDMAVGTARAVSVQVRVNPNTPDQSTVSNTAAVGSQTPDTYPDDNSTLEETTALNQADLSIWKESSQWKVYAGEQVRYDISLTNNGPGHAYNVLISDTLPAAVSYELDTDDCVLVQSDPQDVLECLVPMIGVGETRSFSIFGRVAPDADPGTTVKNVVILDSPADPFNWPEDWNDRDTAPIYIQGKADLKIQKFGKPEGVVRAGEELVYTVVVANLGPSYAHSVVLNDIIESNGVFSLQSVVSDRHALCTAPDGWPQQYDRSAEITCQLTDTLETVTTAPGAGRWMLTVVLTADERQTINNVANVVMVDGDWDPDLSNNEASAEHEITEVADLEIVKTLLGEVLVGCDGEMQLWPDEVAAGANLTYTLTITNHGPSTAENVTVRDWPLPSLIEITDVAPSQGNCDETHLGEPEYLLTCNLDTLSPGATATVEIKAHVPPGLPNGTPMANVAYVSSDMFDDHNGNDLSTNWTTITRWSDLEVLKTQEPEIALPGWDITYSITVTNLGLSDAEGVFISDTIPVQIINPDWTCCASDGGDCDVPCEPPVCPEGPCEWPDPGLFAQADIPAGEWVIYTVEGTLDWWPCGPFTNTVEVIAPPSLLHEGEDIDPCDENNVAEAVNDPFCHFDPLVLKAFPGPDSPP